MLIKNFDQIIFFEPFLLGWERKNDKLVLFLECILSESHPLYEKPQKGQLYCYKLIKFHCKGVSEVVGIDEEKRLPVWNSKSSEYDDIAEIWEFYNEATKLSFIASNFDFTIYCNEAEIEIINEAKF